MYAEAVKPNAVINGQNTHCRFQVAGRSANIEVEQDVKELAQFVLEKFNAVRVLVSSYGCHTLTLKDNNS